MQIDYSSPRAINIPVLLRRSGYHPITDRQANHDSWVRTLGRGYYPRFHLYITMHSSSHITLDLHLDQKQFTMKVASGPRHAGEYDGPTVTAEAERIKRWLAYAHTGGQI